MTATVRPATPDDLDTVLRLADALTREDSDAYGIGTNVAWVTDHGAASYTRAIADARSAVLLAEMDGTIVGSLSGTLRDPSSWRPVRMAEIITLYTAPTWRGQQVGETLVRAFVSWASDRGVARVAVSAFAANAGAVRFYQRVGFSIYEVLLEMDLPADAGPTR